MEAIRVLRYLSGRRVLKIFKKILANERDMEVLAIAICSLVEVESRIGVGKVAIQEGLRRVQCL